MIALEAKEGKYDPSKHAARYEIISKHWEDILKILEEELPSVKVIEKILDTIGICGDPQPLSVSKKQQKLSFKATKDIRDKYVLSRLAWELGILDEICDTI